ncbi:8-oxo-dGTP pyrophosphatase MutT (NUDIX family) [Nocardioides daedukensis]|uniref:8-oxo-dGTP pyrophosphatase MutT (NUDIX family) n=1 Tax=Nocardioides daedukensis TaxID=634462 RepID=A0A7Y9RZ49_9ACTN|nr:8-oxo-dGTP pyrophosphatase MutT (NUDIX family) [Nocardioides daedukensis]
MAFDDRFRFSVHAAVVDEASRSVLLLRQTYGDQRWGLPGGAVEPGETIVATLERECHEELGVDIEIGPLTGWYYHREFESQVGIFRCALPSGAAIRLSEEHSDFRWAPIGELGGVQAARVQAALDYQGTLHAQVF